MMKITYQQPPRVFRMLASLACLALLVTLAASDSLAAAAGPQRTSATAANSKRKVPKPKPFPQCYQSATKAFNFGFYSLATLDYTNAPPTTSPYTPIPVCRFTTANPGDKPFNRIDESGSYGKTNARVGVYGLNAAAMDQAHQAWPMYDSIGKVAVWIVAVPQKFERTEWQYWSADWGGPGSTTGRMLATRYMTNDTAPFKVQGRACVTSRTLVNDYYAVQAPNLQSSLGGFDKTDVGRPSAWGFIAKNALDFSDLDSTDSAKLALARSRDGVLVSCGKAHPLARHSRSVTFKLSIGTFLIPRHHFLGGTSWQRCNPDDPGAVVSEEGQCGTYGQYWAIPGSGLRVIASSTTGVSGGGLPLGLVPERVRFKAIRFLSYCDQNVPRTEVFSESVLVRGKAADGSEQMAAWVRGGHAFWVFGKYFVGGATKYIYGWTPEMCERLPELQQLMRSVTTR
ncbi:MAG: hypothetical protein JHC87_00150 [Thermoleophilaceae bacterium]|nr:hypothetical protein [Thermoleophilaceae bacterium]